MDNDGYTGAPKVIAVAACNRGKRSVYSDFGNECGAPSEQAFRGYSHLPADETASGRSTIAAGPLDTGSNGDGDAIMFTNSFVERVPPAWSRCSCP